MQELEARQNSSTTHLRLSSLTRIGADIITNNRATVRTARNKLKETSTAKRNQTD